MTFEQLANALNRLPADAARAELLDLLDRLQCDGSSTRENICGRFDAYAADLSTDAQRAYHAAMRA